MTLKKKKISNKKERVVLADVLPFELPATFSNRHFYKFLITNHIKIDKGIIQWGINDPTLEVIMKLIFGFDQAKAVNNQQIVIGRGEGTTIPFSFKISHKEKDFRELSIPHPKNQLALVEFYDKYKELILYYCSLSPFSIRRPHKVAKFTYHNDRTHIKDLAHDHEHKSAEEFDKEYENLKTFFVYKEISNVYKFYESYKYHRCEKKYNKLFKFDISKCFDSIYSHSISWALLNKEIVKDKMKLSDNTFGAQFDSLMRNLNYGETNGIIIGPEFSRIFAELILQRIDLNVLHYLRENKDLEFKKDYEIFRYVDDFFVFYNEDSAKDEILSAYKFQLKDYKLYINDSKTILFEKPIITGITIAKQRIGDLLNDGLDFKVSKNEAGSDKNEEADEDQKKYSFYVSSNRLITRFKTIIKETNIAYKDILNYTLACIDRKTLRLIKIYSKIETKNEQEPKVTKAVLELLDFTFFIYSVYPRVNTTIKLCLILSRLIKFSKIKGNFNHDNKHLIFKKIYDDIFLIFWKNKNSEYIQVETLYLLIALKELGREYRLEEALLGKYFGIVSKLKFFRVGSNGGVILSELIKNGILEEISSTEVRLKPSVNLKEDIIKKIATSDFDKVWTILQQIHLDTHLKDKTCSYDFNYFSIVVLLFYIENKPRYNAFKDVIKGCIKSKFESIQKDKRIKFTELTLLFLDLLACPYLDDGFKKDLLVYYDVTDLTKQNDLLGRKDYWFTQWAGFDFGKELEAKKSQEVY